MPFTFAHPAAVLPINYLHKRWISLTGLVAGSLAPDFEYFFRMKDKSHFSHTWAGAFWLDVPLSILLAFIFHNIVRDPLIDHTPGWLKRRLYGYRNFDWNKWFRNKWMIILFSIVIGIISHLIWDRLTHKTVRYINKIPVFNNQSNADTYENDVYLLFWDISSVIGIMIVAYACWQLPVNKQVPVSKTAAAFWVWIGCLTIATLAIRSAMGTYLNIYDYLVSVIAAFLLALILTSGLFKYRYTA